MSFYKSKLCVLCGAEYLPTGRCSRYCITCRAIAKKDTQLRGQFAYRRRQGMTIGRGAKPEKKNPMYSTGRCVFRRWAKEKKESVGLCEFCGKDIKEAKHYQWVGHHKDHNPLNNIIANLIILCKQCHQIEHKCWENFKGVTTSRKT